MGRACEVGGRRRNPLTTAAMFVVPAILSVTLDITQVILYFRQGELFGKERGQPWAHLLDVSASNFDLVSIHA